MPSLSDYGGIVNRAGSSRRIRLEATGRSHVKTDTLSTAKLGATATGLPLSLGSNGLFGNLLGAKGQGNPLFIRVSTRLIAVIGPSDVS